MYIVAPNQQLRSNHILRLATPAAHDTIEGIRVNRLFQLLAATVLLCAAAFPAFAQQGNVLAQVQRMIDSGDNWKALKQLDGLIKREPGNKDARFMRGIVLVQLNRTPDAIKVFTQLTKDFPQLPEPYNNLAVLYAQEGQYDNAKDSLLAAIKTHPSYATAHENLGDIYSTMARQAYNRALELDKANDAARVKLAMLDRIVSPAPGQQAAPVQQQVASNNTAPPVARTYPAPSSTTQAVSRSQQPIVSTNADNRQAILGAVQNWSRAWANQDVNGYLASYSPEFNPPNGLSPRKWSAGRRDRLSRPGSIQLTIQTPEVVMIDPFTAEVTFRQKYRADNYRDSVQKRLTMHKLNNRWMILREDVL